MSCQGGAMTKANTTHATGSNCEQDWRAIHERLIQLSKDAAHIDWDWVASPRAARLRHAPRPLPAHRVGAPVTRGASHRTGQVLFTSGSSGPRVSSLRNPKPRPAGLRPRVIPAQR